MVGCTVDIKGQDQGSMVGALSLEINKPEEFQLWICLTVRLIFKDKVKGRLSVQRFTA